jgi:outer membrane protein OmpA-like peptidoglycan-associated protein
VGFVFDPSIGDRDGDGIKDDVDQCPDDPEDFDGFKDEDGCPDPDNDNDGIPDVDDRCPNVPEDREGDHDEDGCPEQSDGDRDGDGIPDSKDQCPDEPEDRDGFQDEDGCPDPDNDRDGIPDKVDQCPNDPEDKDGFQDEDGCPDPDNDQDGIPDVRDKCPNDPETYNGFEDEDGCPDKGSVIIQDNNIIILEKIKFRTDSAEILPESNRILDAVATTLAHHPEFLLLEIAGHADERASDLRDNGVSYVIRVDFNEPGELYNRAHWHENAGSTGNTIAIWAIPHLDAEDALDGLSHVGKDVYAAHGMTVIDLTQQ